MTIHTNPRTPATAKTINAAAVRYMVIGGQAMQQEGMRGFTLDRDLFVPPRDRFIFFRPEKYDTYLQQNKPR